MTKLVFITAISSILFAAKNPYDSLDLQFVIQQNGNDIAVNEEFTKITLARMPFTLYFNSLPYDTNGKKIYATRIAVSLDEKDFKKTGIGKSTEDIPYFSPGTGNAASGLYEEFYLNEGNQYIFYEPGGDKRAALVSENNGLLRLSCEVPALYLDRRIEFSSTDIKKFYMIVFSDMNLNDMVDAGEFRAIEINLQ